MFGGGSGVRSWPFKMALLVVLSSWLVALHCSGDSRVSLVVDLDCSVGGSRWFQRVVGCSGGGSSLFRYLAILYCSG